MKNHKPSRLEQMIFCVNFFERLQTFNSINSINRTFASYIESSEDLGGLPLSSKTKIVVLHMKELIYTGIFVVLGILLILLLIFMFLPDKKEKNDSTETMQYIAGVYNSSIKFNDNAIDVEVVIDNNKINSISLVNLDETVATMYPLMQPALDNISQQIYEKQSLDNITYLEENQYTSQVLLQAIEQALEKALPENAQ